MGLLLGLARAVPIWAWALAACLAWGGFQRHRATAAAAEMQHQLAAAAAERERGLQASIAETTRRLEAQTEVIHDAESKAARARAAATAADAVGQRLRARLATVDAGACAADPTIALPGPAASSPADLHAYVQRRLDEAADGIARFADDAHVAGTTCERISASLNSTRKDH